MTEQRAGKWAIVSPPKKNVDQSLWVKQISSFHGREVEFADGTRRFATAIIAVFDTQGEAIAQAGEAGTAETTQIGSVHEHAVAESDAPKGADMSEPQPQARAA